MRSEFWRVGHWPTLLSAFLYFDVSFMVWVSLGPLALYIGQALEMAVATRFALVAVPILSGAILRIPLGVLADHFGSKRVGIIAQAVVIMAIFLVWYGGVSALWSAFLFACVLGVAGASFAVALPQVSRWYPPRYQGVAMGMACGAVFQLVPQRFRHDIGAVTGLVGASGGLGGFALAQSLGLSAQWSGHYALGFTVFALLAAAGVMGLSRVRLRWRTTWGMTIEARI